MLPGLVMINWSEALSMHAGSPICKKLFFLDEIIHRLVAASKPSSAAQARQLETTLSSARKLLRLGTCIDAIHASVASVGHPDIVLRVTITLSRISNAMFLLCDHFIWLHRAKVINVDVDGWNELSNRWWLYGDIMNLARDIYEVRKEGSFLLENKPLLVDLVKNLADIILPLAALGTPNSPITLPHICLRILEGSSNCCISGRRLLGSWHRPNAQPQASPLVVVPE